MNNHKGNFTEQSCEFAEQMVANLYGEVSDAEKSRFGAHLLECSACSEEFDDFGSVLNSIREWRAEDFEPLATPVFVLPKAENVTAVSHSWLDSIRAYLTFSPAWAAAIPVILLAAAGLFFWLSTGTKNAEPVNNNSLAEVNRKAIQKGVSQPTRRDENQPFTNEADISPNAAPVKSVNNKKQNSAPKNAEFSGSAPNGIENKSAVKVKNQSTATSPVSVPKNAVKPSNKSVAPTLSPDGDEDDALQLSDLFEEVSLK